MGRSPTLWAKALCTWKICSLASITTRMPASCAWLVSPSTCDLGLRTSSPTPTPRRMEQGCFSVSCLSQRSCFLLSSPIDDMESFASRRHAAERLFCLFSLIRAWHPDCFSLVSLQNDVHGHAH